MMDFEETCEVDTGKFKFQITDEGKISYQLNNSQSNITISLPDGFSFESVRSYEVKNKVAYFNIEISDICSGSSQLFAIDLSNRKLIWQVEIPAFNSSELLISGNYIYVGGMGYIAKIERTTGKKMWFIDSLYERETQAYNGFNKPFILDRNVVFPEDKVGKYPNTRKVVVDIESGRLIAK